MTVKGDLNTFSFACLLQILSYEEKTGRLWIKSENNLVQMFLRNGNLLFATESRKSNRIGSLLVNHGIIDQKALDTCLALSRERNQGIGTTLVQEEYLTLHHLNTFLLRQAENTIYNVMLWESGEFIYKDEQINMKTKAGGNLDTMNLLLEASRRIDELSVLKKRIPDDQIVLKRCENWEQTRAAELDASERRLLALVDGNRTVRDLLDQTGYDDFTGFKALYTLIASGAIEPVSFAMQREQIANQAFARLQAIDASRIRAALDHFGLKRSSALRIALTRIFRDAADSEQLLTAVKRDSRKIKDSPDLSELPALKENSSNPFLKDLLEIIDQAVHEETTGN
ncbi:MAG: DUF4388 domain-containing protein [Desulfobacterales bacterium]|nr:DUF4388 domain-containing protein [Desulfobacterales bacterium]